MNAAAALALAMATVCTPPGRPLLRLRALRPDGPRRVTVRPGQVLALLAAAGIGLVAAGPGGALAAAVVASVLRARHRAHRARRTATVTATELVDALRRITDELRAGAHPAAALAGVRSDGPQARAVLAPAAAAARLGDGVPAALVHSGPAALAGDLHRVAAAWGLADRHGVPLAELLAATGADLGWRLRFAGQVRAQLAGPRATATVLTALPVLGLLLGELVGAGPVAVLRTGPLGQTLLVLGVGLAAAGAVWSDRILASAVP